MTTILVERQQQNMQLSDWLQVMIMTIEVQDRIAPVVVRTQCPEGLDKLYRLCI